MYKMYKIRTSLYQGNDSSMRPLAMYIPTGHQVMDLLTKPLGWVNHAA